MRVGDTPRPEEQLYRGDVVKAAPLEGQRPELFARGLWRRLFHPNIVHLCSVRRGDRDVLVLGTYKRPAPRDAVL